MPDWNPRNTLRARALRRAAPPAERALWQHLARSQLGAKFSRQMPVGPWFADFLCRELLPSDFKPSGTLGGSEIASKEERGGA